MTVYERIKQSFDKQGLMNTLNARLTAVQEGEVRITSQLSPGLTQQHGFFHAGVMTSLADTACGYAAWTMMPLDKDVLTVEFKVNFLKPANTAEIIATGKVLQAGKNLVICEGQVFDEEEKKLLAKMIATMMAIPK